MMEKFDFFVPFGSRCATAYHLRHAGKQGESLPLDWVGVNKLEKSIDILQNHFKDFLILEKLTRFQNKKNNNNIGYQMPDGMLFLHDFSTENPQDDFDKIKQKYDRRIERLYQYLDRADKVLFVHCHNEEYTQEELCHAYERLKKLYPLKKIKLLCVYLTDKQSGYKYRFRSENIDAVDMEFGTNPDPKAFWIGKVAVFNQMMKNYPMTLRSRFSQWINCKKHKFAKNFDKM